MTTDNTNTTRNDSLAARTDIRFAVVAGLVTRTAGYHQNGGTGADGPDHANRILHLDQTWMFLLGVGPFRASPWCGG